MWWAFIAGALAWTADDLAVWSAPSDVRDVLVAPHGDSPALWVVDDEGVSIVGFDGVTRGRLRGGGNGLLHHDLDGDGAPELLLCGPRGVQLIPVASGTMGVPLPLDSTPCDVLAVTGDEVPALLAFHRGAARRIAPDDRGMLQATPTGLELDQPLVAGAAGNVAAASRGASTLTLIRPEGDALLPTGGPITAVGTDGHGILWAVGGEAPFVQHGSRRTELAAEAVGVAGIPLDELTPHLAWSASAWLLPAVELPLPSAPVATADLDADGCRDLIVPSGTELLFVHGACGFILAAPDIEPIELSPIEETIDTGQPWPPTEWVEGERVPVEDLPPPPKTLDLPRKGPWPTITVFAGSSTSIDLTIEGVPGRRLRSKGGAPTQQIYGSRLTLDPTPDEIGTWTTSVRAGAAQWTGFHVDVWPRPQPGEPLPEGVGVAVLPSREERSPPPPPSSPARPWTLGRCSLGAGLAGGASESGGLTWQSLGNPEVSVRFSPAVGVVCPGGGEGLVQWVVGFDAAPWFRYVDIPTDRSHLFGATAGLGIGTEALRVGPYGSAGITAVNVGLRSQVRPSGGHYALEVRAGWLAPRSGFEAMLLFLRRL